jgi:beta-galactosidase
MKKLRLLTICLFTAVLTVINGCSGNEGREEINFNLNWKFLKGDTINANDPSFDDSSWRIVDLPHDWSIEGPFSKEYASGTGYLPGGIGWYRKTFTIPYSERGRKVFIYFGGIYNNSEVWINGKLLGKRPNGYISFQYDLTPHVRFGGRNTIAVKADHTKFGDSRWYTGSGIYRDVKLVYTPLVHIEQWGVFASAYDVSAERARLGISVSVVNESDEQKEIVIYNYLLSGTDTVATSSENLSVEKNGNCVYNGEINVDDPVRWDIENPVLYSLVTVVKGKDVYDIMTTRTGFRDIRFDAGTGFWLNGRNLKLKGICMHHDAGALGAAVPKTVLARRLDIVKELGCNAIRTSHNPFSEDFFDLCDEKGFLVIGEAFDEWELPKKKWIAGWNAGTPGKDGYADDFKEWHEQDLRDMILRDRNHPSLIMWSIGNEVDYPNDPYTHQVLNTEANPQTWAKFSEELPHGDRLGEIARKLAAIVRELDTTRPVTAGLASALMSNETGYAEALDVAGYNYQEYRYKRDHEMYPDRIIYGSENGQSLEAWNAVVENDYVMGQFLWTGIEYLGEAGRFPSRHSTSGIIDLAGNRKPEFFFRQSLWSDKPMVYIGTTDRLEDRGPVSLWAHKRVDPVWNYEEGTPVIVNVFTNCDEAELFINDRSLGSKKLSDFRNRTISWIVPFEKGTLRATGCSGGDEMAAFVLRTAGEPSKLVAISDTPSLIADRQDVAHVSVSICDQDGNMVYSADNEITCDVTGPVRVIGMEDANPRNTEDYKDNKQKSYHGKLLIYVQALDKPGDAILKLSSPGLMETELKLGIIN